MGKTKRPKVKEEPTPEKIPKFKDPLIGDFPLAWRFSACDKGGPFSWAVLEGASDLNNVLARMSEFEKMNWNEIISAKCHPIECNRLEKEARDRLVEISQDDLDELMSFRITGENRVWCIKHDHIMRVLWWDPDHKVYKTERDKADRAKRHRRERR